MGPTNPADESMISSDALPVVKDASLSERGGEREDALGVPGPAGRVRSGGG
jgi:hypothetical protein